MFLKEGKRYLFIHSTIIVAELIERLHGMFAPWIDGAGDSDVVFKCWLRIAADHAAHFFHRGDGVPVDVDRDVNHEVFQRVRFLRPLFLVRASDVDFPYD